MGKGSKKQKKILLFQSSPCFKSDGSVAIKAFTQIEKTEAEVEADRLLERDARRQKWIDIQEKEKAERTMRDIRHRGYKVQVPMEKVLWKNSEVEVPVGISHLALRFVILFLVNNLDALQCSTVEAFSELFGLFFENYVFAPDTMFEWVITSSRVNIDDPAWPQHFCDEFLKLQETPHFPNFRIETECYEFLKHVNVSSCLKSIALGRGGFYSWVTMGCKGSLHWNIKQSFFETFVMPDFVYYGFYENQKKENEKQEQEQEYEDMRKRYDADDMFGFQKI